VRAWQSNNGVDLIAVTRANDRDIAAIVAPLLATAANFGLPPANLFYLRF